MVATVLLSAVIGLIGGGLAAWAIYTRFGPVERVTQTNITGTTPGSAAGLSTGSIAQAASASVVEVLTNPSTSPSLLTPTGIVDGFVVSANGLVISSIHAIHGATELRIATAAGASYDAKIVAADPIHGVVLLRAMGAIDLKPLTFATVPPQIGDLVIAVAHAPFSPVLMSVGTVSSVGVTVSLSDGEKSLQNVFTVDAVPDSREDGAPILDGNGDVVGVVVDAGNAAPGVVCLSMSAAADLVSSQANGVDATAPTLGVQSDIIDPATAALEKVPSGALVISVTPAGPAALAGVMPGDIVLDVGTIRMDIGHPLDATSLGLAPHQLVTLSVYRDGHIRTIDLTVGPD